MFTYHPPTTHTFHPPPLSVITASHQQGIVDTSIFFLSVWCNMLAMWICRALQPQQWLFNGWPLLLCQLFRPHSFLGLKIQKILSHEWTLNTHLKQPVAKIVLTVVQGRFGVSIEKNTWVVMRLLWLFFSNRGNGLAVMSSGQHLRLQAVIVFEMTLIRFPICWVAFVRFTSHAVKSNKLSRIILIRTTSVNWMMS